MRAADADAAAVSARLGHGHVTVYENARGLYFYACSCGHVSTLAQLERTAADGAMHHFLTPGRRLIRWARQQGMPIEEAIELERKKPTRPPTNSGALPKGGWILPIR